MPPSRDANARNKDCGQRITECQCGKLLALIDEEPVGANDECACSNFGQGCKSLIKVASLLALSTRSATLLCARRAHPLVLAFSIGIGWVDEEAHHRGDFGTNS